MLKQPASNAERGKYSSPGTRRERCDILSLDVSLNEVWTGTEQMRFFTLDLERLNILTAWLPHPTHPEHRMMRGILSFERAK